MRARSTLAAAALSLGASSIVLGACAELSTTSDEDTTTTAAQADGNPRFGETANTTATFSSGPNVPLEITVAPPEPFTPTDPADATQAANVAFQVTLTNRSTTEPFTVDVVVTSAICGLGDDPSTGELAGGGSEGDPIFDSEAGISGVDGSPVLQPGKSLTFKEGFSVECPDDVTYKIQPAGLAADTLYFQN